MPAQCAGGVWQGPNPGTTSCWVLLGVPAPFVSVGCSAESTCDSRLGSSSRRGPGSAPVKPASLDWRTCPRPPLEKAATISFPQEQSHNIDESLAYRSLLRHLAKTRPSSRFCVLLDSRVVIGCSAKGRSSSTQLIYYLSTGLPYLIGGDLYPYQLHVGTHENPADDVSRFVDLRDPQIGLPRWLVCLLKGDAIKFDLVREADRLQWPWSGWARRLMLASARQRQSMKCHA